MFVFQCKFAFSCWSILVLCVWVGWSQWSCGDGGLVVLWQWWSNVGGFNSFLKLDQLLLPFAFDAPSLFHVLSLSTFFFQHHHIVASFKPNFLFFNSLSLSWPKLPFSLDLFSCSILASLSTSCDWLELDPNNVLSTCLLLSLLKGRFS